MDQSRFVPALMVFMFLHYFLLGDYIYYNTDIPYITSTENSQQGRYAKLPTASIIYMEAVLTSSRSIDWNRHAHVYSIVHSKYRRVLLMLLLQYRH